MTTHNQEAIRKLAYELWDRAGRPHGRDQDFYYEAERRLAQQGTGTMPKAREVGGARSTTRKTKPTA